jgi:hypothetical protein
VHPQQEEEEVEAAAAAGAADLPAAEGVVAVKARP